MIHPHGWASGTKKKPYTTCTVDRTLYSDSTESPTTSPLATWDSQRLKEKDYRSCAYLLEKNLVSGPVVVASRGKLLAIGAGHVSSIPVDSVHF